MSRLAGRSSCCTGHVGLLQCASEEQSSVPANDRLQQIACHRSVQLAGRDGGEAVWDMLTSQAMLPGQTWRAACKEHEAWLHTTAGRSPRRPRLCHG